MAFTEYRRQTQTVMVMPCMSATIHHDDAPGVRARFSPKLTDSNQVPQITPQLKTFLVEDSRVIRENLIATLEELGPVKVVGTAEDEMTAVQWLNRPSNEVDLVVVDIFLKGGSGLGVLRATHALRQQHKTVVLSNYATPDMRRKCLELGADKVFDKSNEIDALILYCSRLADGDPGDSGLDSLA